MKRSVYFAVLMLLLSITAEQQAFGPRGGGARPSGGGGPRPGGVSPGAANIQRPNVGAHPGVPPQMSRPATPVQRSQPPVGGGGFAPSAARPNVGNSANARPNVGSPANVRPNVGTPANVGNLANARPNVGQSRPNVSRPNVDLANRPNVGNVANNANIANRPNVGNVANNSNIANRSNVANNANIANRGANVGNLGDRTNINQANLQNRLNQSNVNNLTNVNRGGNTVITNPTVNVGNRTNVGVANRPNLNVGNRSVNVNANNINVNQWNQYNRTNVGVQRNYWNQPANWNRPSYYGRPAATWGRPWYWNHSTWHNGYWRYWAAPPAIWLAGSTAGWLSSPGESFTYVNPYYAAPESTTIVVPPALDYSNPIPQPTVEQSALAVPPEPTQEQLDALSQDPNAVQLAAPPAPASTDPKVDTANQTFDQARAAFKSGDYAGAQKLVEKAIVDLPSDATLHEFRALTLFAQKRYQDAAGPIYAVLAAGPGWDWTTVSSLYGDPNQYTAQLRDLEAFVKSNPTAGYARFLLAYQYLVVGGKDAAVGQLREVVKLTPDDKLSAALLNALTQDNQGANAPPVPGGM